MTEELEQKTSFPSSAPLNERTDRQTGGCASRRQRVILHTLIGLECAMKYDYLMEQLRMDENEKTNTVLDP